VGDGGKRGESRSSDKREVSSRNARESGFVPRKKHDLSKLKGILSTGSPLAHNSFRYVYSKIKSDGTLASISGGMTSSPVLCSATDSAGLPGEIQTPGLGMRWTCSTIAAAGQANPGELVCTRPFPSIRSVSGTIRMGQVQGRLFRLFPGVWRHGDWAEITKHRGYIIYGRSDGNAQSRRGRIGPRRLPTGGTAPESSKASRSDRRSKGGSPGDVRIVLFVKLQPGLTLDDGLWRKDLLERAGEHHAAPRAQKIIQSRTFADNQRKITRAGGARSDSRPAGQKHRSARESQALRFYERLEKLRD